MPPSLPRTKRAASITTERDARRLTRITPAFATAWARRMLAHCFVIQRVAAPRAKPRRYPRRRAPFTRIRAPPPRPDATLEEGRLSPGSGPPPHDDPPPPLRIRTPPPWRERGRS